MVASEVSALLINKGQRCMIKEALSTIVKHRVHQQIFDRSRSLFLNI